MTTDRQACNILLIEDDAALRSGIALALRDRGRVHLCAGLGEARQALEQLTPDLLLLDIGLPDGSGLDFCRMFRQESSVPIIFLTANDTELDEVMGLEAGGDDYITKPFSLAILRARVDAALRRRRSPSAVDSYHCGTLEFRFQELRFFRDGLELTLSRTEQRLLQLLVENRGRTLPRTLLLDRVWGTAEYVDENALSVAVRRLRGKLEEDPGHPRWIRTVYGVGYVWTESEEASWALS